MNESVVLCRWRILILHVNMGLMYLLKWIALLWETKSAMDDV